MRTSLLLECQHTFSSLSVSLSHSRARLSGGLEYVVRSCTALPPITFKFMSFSLFVPPSWERSLGKALVPKLSKLSFSKQDYSAIYSRRLLDYHSSTTLSSSTLLFLPGVSTSAWSTWELGDVRIYTDVIEFHEFSPPLLRPALYLNGSFSLDREPFNWLGLHGSLNVEVEVTPWYETQPSELDVPATVPMELTLTADYPINVEVASGITITDAYLVVALQPMPLMSDVSVRTSFTLGGSVSFQVSGQEQPLVASARVTVWEDSSAVSFTASLEDWRNAFGLPGVNLDLLSLSGEIISGKVDLVVSALLSVDDETQYQLQGVKQGGFYALGMEITKFSLADVGLLFRKYSAVRLINTRDSCLKLAAGCHIDCVLCPVFACICFSGSRFMARRRGVRECVSGRGECPRQRARLLCRSWRDTAGVAVHLGIEQCGSAAADGK